MTVAAARALRVLRSNVRTPFTVPAAATAITTGVLLVHTADRAGPRRTI